ncbi:major facilitator superfamily transporter [Pyrenophora seminiperda CCB06]|uniref:Major facilitator superfamily transporter n=1 Tax=Pyrenophora seminiperda CCB06 TaxID=1302712 RepID=A0A3M7LVF3_9PLEO|nr:major facilitator superfamily transporter [Pyrenophora seminiperda CCB06]
MRDVDHDEEVAALLQSGSSAEIDVPNSPQNQLTAPTYFLPIALLAALAMASTAATAYFAYATILCNDAQHCEGTETSKYAGLVAASTCIANILGMFALGGLQKLAISNRKGGLLLWVLFRSMSSVMLLVGVSVNNIYVALSGRVFEGLASDNLLHFSLNAVYAQSPNQDTASSLMAYSLALYMIGISVSPFIAGLFANFTVSFFMALGLFAASIVYLQVFVRASWIEQVPVGEFGRKDVDLRSTWKRWLKTANSPMKIFQANPFHIFTGASLFFYNIVQSYMFQALMVHTSVHFGFTGRSNGFVLSIAHSVAATYIFVTIFAVPNISRRIRSNYSGAETRSGSRVRDLVLALVSLTVQILSLVALGLATRSWQIYCIAASLAVGLCTPSFIKAYSTSWFASVEKPAALAALAMMETLGSVLGPVVLGGLQSYLSQDAGVFYVAAGLSVASFLSLAVGYVVGRATL